MNDSGLDDICRLILCDLASLKDINITPGQILQIVRTGHNIPAKKIADILQISVSELNDIESGRAPFPTILLMLIFVYGLPAWFQAIDD